AAVGRSLPLRRDPAPLQKPLQGGIERAVVHQKLVAGLLFEKLRDTVRVVRAKLQAAQDQDFQRALQEFQALPWIVYRRHTTYIRQSGGGCQGPACRGGQRYRRLCFLIL